MTGLLALDAATTTGWALWSAGLSTLQFGQRRFDGGVGQFAHEFECWLTELLVKESPEHVFIEAPLTGTHRFTTLATTLRLIGAQVIAQKLCYRLSIPLTSVSVTTWRKHFVGHSRAPKTVPKAKRRRWLKDCVMTECRRHGWNVESDDAADALGLLSFALNASNITECGQAMAA